MEPLTQLAVGVAVVGIVYCLIPTGIAALRIARDLWHSMWKPMLRVGCIELWKRGHLSDGEAMRLWGKARLLGLHMVVFSGVLFVTAMVNFEARTRWSLALIGAVIIGARVILHFGVLLRLRSGGFVRRK